MTYRYFISYYRSDSFFKRGFGWAEVVHNKKLSCGNDMLEMQALIENKWKYKKVIVINFILLDGED